MNKPIGLISAMGIAFLSAPQFIVHADKNLA